MAALIVVFALLFASGRAHAMCCPIPCRDGSVASDVQVSYVVMDRKNDRVDLIPNIRFAGISEDFSLIVPTPTRPTLSAAPDEIWDQAAQLTSAGTSTQSYTSFSCTIRTGAPLDSGEPSYPWDGITVHGRVTMRDLSATTVSSDDPAALVRWLDDNGFEIGDADSARFAPYVARKWFFTAMRPNTAAQMPDDGWDADVMPMRMSYSAADFEVPLPILTVNRSPQLVMQFYVLDNTKTQLDGFTTLYANRLNTGEVESIREKYPALADLVEPGRVLTKLRATEITDEMASASIPLKRAPDNDEVRVARNATDEAAVGESIEGGRIAGRSIPGELGLLAAAAFMARPVRRRTRVRER
jgi:hypothetical protein